MEQTVLGNNNPDNPDEENFKREESWYDERNFVVPLHQQEVQTSYNKFDNDSSELRYFYI